MAYVTAAEVRCEGVPASISDQKITDAIALWQQFIERACRQWFESRLLTVQVDGNDSDILFLPVPVISVTSLFVNNDFVNALPTVNYKVYSGRSEPNDDRRNPKIRLVSLQTIFDPPVFPLRAVFAKGQQNQKIVGEFGFTESSATTPFWTTPLLIKRALVKLVIRDLQTKGSGGLWAAVSSGGLPAGAKAFEMTDGHSVQYATPQSKITKAGLSGVTGDNEIDAILVLYRAPIAMAVPSSPLY